MVGNSRFDQVHGTLARLTAQGRLKRILFNADNKAELQACSTDISGVISELQLGLLTKTQSKMREVQEEVEQIHDTFTEEGNLA